MDASFVLKRIILFVLSAMVVALVILVLFADVYWFHNGVKETSLTETLQEVILLIIAGLFGFRAARNETVRYSSALIGGFFACLFIREMDFAFDYIAHGAWVWFALAITLAVVVYCLRKPAMTLAQLADYMRHPSYGMMVSGLLAVLVFSRIFGMNLLWQEMMFDGYSRLVKNMVEEGCELYGYAVCLLATFWYLRTTPRLSA